MREPSCELLGSIVVTLSSPCGNNPSVLSHGASALGKRRREAKSPLDGLATTRRPPAISFTARVQNRLFARQGT